VRPSRLTLFVIAGLVLFASPLPALAQSCALCYTQAASAGARMIEALKSGILVLIAPPTLASIAMIFVVYRKRNQVRKTAGTAESDAIWKSASLSNSATTSWLPPTH
jgi:hypothetical protein